MTSSRFTSKVVMAVGITTAFAGGLPAQDATTLPVRYRATVMVLDALAPGTAKVEIAGDATAQDPQGLPTMPGPQSVGAPAGIRTAGRAADAALLAIAIERWSADEEKSTLAQSLKSGGTKALVSAMEKMTVGHLQVNGDLRLPIRVASTWKTENGQMVRLATNGPILYGESAKAGRSTDYPIGIIEFTVPPDGRGEGTLVAATRAGFDDRGQIRATSMPIGSGTQRLTNVEREAPGRNEN